GVHLISGEILPPLQPNTLATCSSPIVPLRGICSLVTFNRGVIECSRCPFRAASALAPKPSPMIAARPIVAKTRHITPSFLLLRASGPRQRDVRRGNRPAQVSAATPPENLTASGGVRRRGGDVTLRRLRSNSREGSRPRLTPAG